MSSCADAQNQGFWHNPSQWSSMQTLSPCLQCPKTTNFVTPANTRASQWLEANYKSSKAHHPPPPESHLHWLWKKVATPCMECTLQYKYPLGARTGNKSTTNRHPLRLNLHRDAVYTRPCRHQMKTVTVTIRCRMAYQNGQVEQCIVRQKYSHFVTVHGTPTAAAMVDAMLATSYPCPDFTPLCLWQHHSNFSNGRRRWSKAVSKSSRANRHKINQIPSLSAPHCTSKPGLDLTTSAE